MSENIKKILGKINEYLGLFIVVPAVLGGLWQILELSYLSPSFIRFFSVTQVASDGLLVMVIVFVISVPILLLTFRVRKAENIDDKKIESENKRPFFWQNLIIAVILITSGMLLFIFLILPLIHSLNTEFGLFEFAGLLFAASFALYCFFLGIRAITSAVFEIKPSIREKFSRYYSSRIKDPSSSWEFHLIALLTLIVFGIALIARS